MYQNIIKNNKIIFSIFLFIFLYSLVLISKPPLIFDKNGSFRHFGIGYDKRTVLPIWLISFVLGIFSYFSILFYSNQNNIYF